MVSVTMLLLVAALILVIANAVGKCPLWIPVLLLTVAMLLSVLPR